MRKRQQEYCLPEKWISTRSLAARWWMTEKQGLSREGSISGLKEVEWSGLKQTQLEMKSQIQTWIRFYAWGSQKGLWAGSKTPRTVMEISATSWSYMKVFVFHSARRDLNLGFHYNPENIIHKAYEVFEFFFSFCFCVSITETSCWDHCAGSRS